MGRRLMIGVEDHLDHTLPVPKVNEDKAAMVSPPMHPAHESHSLARMIES
jgi:hypothetical protein